MAASRRGQPPSSIRLPPSTSPGSHSDLPLISALFLIEFDVKAGYTILWKRALHGIGLDGIVEYKSLPSGLHTVSEDLVYFVHDDGYAGLSAFVNAPTDEEDSRHARMIAVGILVPLSYGRLGRAWRHSQHLRDMASQLVIDRNRTDILDRYWESNSTRDSTSASASPADGFPLRSPSFSHRPTHPVSGKAQTRNRSASDGTVLAHSSHTLSPHHPARSLTALLDTFGPLIFPIYRAALLRTRILISTHAPVREACNFVYDISILSNIPLPVLDLLDPSAPVQRLKPLFTVGVHDIPFLLQHKAALNSISSRGDDGDCDAAAAAEGAGVGWVACTTDSILSMKEDLWDMLIVMPSAHSSDAKERVWPTVECPKGVPVKATQRDLRRFRSLQAGLSRLESLSCAGAGSQPSADASPRQESPIQAVPGHRRSSSARSLAGVGGDLDAIREDETDKIVEPPTWAALAYSGFMWWASAGEQRRTEEVDELSQDATLLADLEPARPAMRGMHGRDRPGDRRASRADSHPSGTDDEGHGHGHDQGHDQGHDEQRAGTELAVIAYFHRLTTHMLSVLADVVETSDEDDVVDMSQDGPDPGEEVGLLRRGEDGSTAACVRVDSCALANMGLDVWAATEAEFVRELTARYFARRALVEGKGVEVCGLRVC